MLHRHRTKPQKSTIRVACDSNHCSSAKKIITFLKMPKIYTKFKRNTFCIRFRHVFKSNKCIPTASGLAVLATRAIAWTSRIMVFYISWHFYKACSQSTKVIPVMLMRPDFEITVLFIYILLYT